MICYFHNTECLPPSWLRGAHDLCSRVGIVGGYLYGIGPSYLLGNKPDDAVELDDGWVAWVNGEIDTVRLRRDVSWCKLIPSIDLSGAIWHTPEVLDASGKRTFRTRYGKDFRPLLSDEQTKAVEIATEARTLMARLLKDGAEPNEEEQCAMCGWAATLACMTNHLSIQVVARLGLMDDSLATSTLVGATSFDPDNA